MARYAAEGAQVTLVTCTLGEEGEILVPGLEHLAADAHDRLGEHRAGELAAAMACLGVSDHRLLGGPGRFRDSGMMGTDANARPDSFWRADLLEATDLLVPVIREVRPQVVLTYDQFGGYGHPDHIQAHRVATYGVALAGVASYRPELGPAWVCPKVYWNAMPRSYVAAGIERMREQGSDFFGVESVDDLPFVVPDEAIDAMVDGSTYASAKVAAMRAHATQIAVDGPFFALSNQVGMEVWAREFYRLAVGRPGPLDPQTGWETDLFAGVA
jgi:N-acetyl-1-D-myo-inositol-2-amino-2-deoxy-alpha-D-glucopyranoside deacetylase